MNYSKKGIKRKQKQLNSTSVKIEKMFLLYFLKAILVCIIGIGIVGCCMGIGMFNGILASSPDISTLDVTPSGYATFVYDAEGNQMTKLVATNSNRSYVNMNSIPKNLANAFVAIEDERFYEHNGIDIKGIARAGMEAIKSKFKFSQGASTITQQLLKNNVFDDTWVTETNLVNKFKRKFQEQYLALELEKRMSKDDILELYMNSINLGQNTLGVQAASKRYFDKNVSDLTLSECAVIAGITQNPSKYNPISHPDKNAERREKVLNNMLEQGYITQSEYNTAMDDDVYSRIKTVNESMDVESVNTYFVDAVIDQVIKDLMDQLGYNETQAYNLVYSGGLQINTTQDPEIQKICDEVYNDESNYPSNVKWLLHYELTIDKANGDTENHSTEMFKSYFKQSDANFDLLYSSQDKAYEAIEQYKAAVMGSGDKVEAENIVLTPQPQVSLTIEDQHTGYIVAMIGGRGTKASSRSLNRATSTTRQPGSTFKIVSTYAPALDSAGLTLASVQDDAPFNYDNGRPVSNWYGGAYKGICTLRYGIEQSLNIVAVKTLTQITPQLGFDYLQKFGFTTLVERRAVTNSVTGKTEIYSDIQQALALGGITDGVTNMELNASYATIANGGVYIQPALYTTILDHDGNVILDRTNPETRRVLQETTAFLLTDAMVDVVTKGTGRSVNFGGMSIAGKTGTTSSYRDVWFAGYTPYYTATTWTGYDNNEIMHDSAEKNLSKTMWRAVMSKIHENLPNKEFTKPDGIVTASVCEYSGKLPVAGICTPHTEYFAEGTVPTETCDAHYAGTVCAVTGLPADPACPFQVPGYVTIPPSVDGTPASQQVCPHNASYYANNPEAFAADSQAAQAAQQQAAAQAAQDAQNAAQAAQDAANAANAAQADATTPDTGAADGTQ